MTKCIQRIRDLFEYALYKFTLYLLTYFVVVHTPLHAVARKNRRPSSNIVPNKGERRKVSLDGLLPNVRLIRFLVYLFSR